MKTLQEAAKAITAFTDAQIESSRRMPAQKPHRSVQEVQTDPRFIKAVEERFGALSFDLAADASNCQAGAGNYFGPGSARAVDSLKQDWSALSGNLWLNPPFSRIGLWADKCAAWQRGLGERGDFDNRILLLVPASVGANWWRDYIDKKAAVKFLNGRLTFVGHTAPYPKDMALCIYSLKSLVEKGGYAVWNWSKDL